LLSDTVFLSDSKIASHLDEIMQVYSSYSGYELEIMTHEEDPWLNARGNLELDEPSCEEITIKDMASFYKKLAEEE